MYFQMKLHFHNLRGICSIGTGTEWWDKDFAVCIEVQENKTVNDDCLEKRLVLFSLEFFQ